MAGKRLGGEKKRKQTATFVVFESVGVPPRFCSKGWQRGDQTQKGGAIEGGTRRWGHYSRQIGWEDASRGHGGEKWRSTKTFILWTSKNLHTTGKKILVAFKMGQLKSDWNVPHGGEQRGGGGTKGHAEVNLGRINFDCAPSVKEETGVEGGVKRGKRG